MDQVIALSNQTEGRDKFSKAIQYISQFLKWYLNGKNDKAHQMFKSLQANMSKARKLFRLFKSVNEYHKLVKFLDDCSDGMPILVLGVITRIGLLVFWFFDNLQVLSMINFLKGNPDSLKKIGMTGWLLALLSTIISEILKVISLFQEIGEDNASIERAKARGEEAKSKVDYFQRTKALKQAKLFASYLTIIKSLGDLTTASAGSGIAKKLFKRQPNEGMIGIGGSSSAIITLYTLWPKKK